MKGIVFTELFDVITKLFGEDMVDDVLDDCTLESGGAYTSVGIYSPLELIEIVNVLSNHTKVPFRELVETYGYHLFSRFHDLMPNFFIAPQCAFEFLESVDGTIHIEVKKLYPEASLPKFETSRTSSNQLIMIYKSKCPFADFAAGLMRGCIDFYKEDIQIDYEDVNTKDEYSRVFTLTRS